MTMISKSLVETEYLANVSACSPGTMSSKNQPDAVAVVGAESMGPVVVEEVGIAVEPELEAGQGMAEAADVAYLVGKIDR